MSICCDIRGSVVVSCRIFQSGWCNMRYLFAIIIIYSCIFILLVAVAAAADAMASSLTLVYVLLYQLSFPARE